MVSSLVLSLLALTTLPADSAVVDSFDKVFSTQTNGSISITGNALLTCNPAFNTASANCQNSLSGSGTGTTGNNNLRMVALDADADPSTTSSSSARLSVPAGGSVLYAGLYWSAATKAGSNGVDAPAGNRGLSFRTPGTAGYQSLTPQTINTLGTNGFAGDYSAFRDVTTLVRGAGAGDYWAGNIQAATGADRYASWSLVVVLADPNAPLRDLSVFNGYATVSSGERVDASISGFLTPPTGTVNAKVGMVVYEGDQQLTGDYFAVNGQRLSDAESPADNFFRSRVTANGGNLTDRSPANLNTLGTDAKVVDAAGSIPNGATSANLQFASSGDVYYPAVLTTQVDLYAPTIVGTKTVADLTGNNPAQIGDTLEYTLSFTNTGDDTATGAVVRDALPSNVTYVPGSLRVTSGANLGSKTDATDADQGEYLPGSRSIRVRAGPGASGTAGGSLAKNATTAVRFRVRVDAAAAGTTVVNEANLDYTAATFGKAFTYTTGPARTPVGALADLAITKSASPEPVDAGALLTYTLTVRNNGPNAAEVSRVVDSLPDGVTFVSASPGQGSCSHAAGTVSCLLGTLANGSTTTVTVVARVGSDFSAAGLINAATVAADTSDPVPTNNTASAVSTVGQAADLQLSKTVSPSNPRPGQPVTYTLTATNDGPSDAGSVVVADTVPAVLADVAATTTAGRCSVDGSEVRCTLATLGAGSSVRITVTATLDPSSTGGAFSNTGSVSSATADPVPGNNSDSVTVSPGAPRADLAVTKTTVTAPVVAGAPVEYQVTVRNDGPSTATAVRLDDPSPAAVGALEANPSQGSCTTGDGVACALGPLPPGSSATVTITGIVSPGAAGTLTNTATASSATPDADPTNDTGTASDTVTSSADLDLDKTATSPLVDGQDVTYTLTVTNHGPSVSRDVVVTDPVPSPLGFLRATSSQGGCVQAAGLVTCDLGTLGVADRATISVVASTPPGGGADGVGNTARVSSTTADPRAADNTATHTLSSRALADLAMSKTVSASTLTAGGPVSWTLTATNRGPSTAVDVAVTDTVPADVELGPLPPGCALSGSTVRCTTATLGTSPDADTFSVTLTGVVGPGVPAGPLVNTASVTARTPDDPTTSNNSDTAIATVVTSADLDVVKSAPSTAVAGSTVDYTLRVSSTGPSTARDVTLSDQLPAGTTFVPVAGSSCALQPDSDRLVVCQVGDVPPGADTEVTLRVRVAPDVADGTVLSNAAQVSSSTPDPDLGDNADDADVTVAARADLSVLKSATPTRLVAGLEGVYRVQVTNAGPSDAQTVSVRDVLPVGTSFVEATTTVGVCTASDGAVTCGRPTLAAGAIWTIDVRVLVDPDTTTQVVNRVAVTSGTTDPTASDDTFELTSPVDAAGDLAVVKSATPDPVVPGRQVTYTMVVADFGPASMAGTTLADQLPAGLTEATATSSQGTCVLSGPAPQRLGCDLGTVRPGAPVTIRVAALLDAAYDRDTLANTGAVSSTTTDRDPGNDTGEVVTPVSPAADLALTKRAGADPVIAGRPFDYRLTATNLGPSVARDVVVTDTLPAALTVLSADAEGQPCTLTGATVTCRLGDLPPGQVAVTVRVRPDPSYVGTSVTNTAHVDSSTADPDPGNDDATTRTPVEALADVSLTKERLDPPPPGPVVAGRRVTWRISTSNTDGPSTARGVVISDPVDPALLEVTARGTGCAVGTDNLVRCAVGALEVGQSASVVVAATLPSDVTGPLRNIASVSTTTRDPDVTDNDASNLAPVTAQADVSITKTRTSGPIVPGGSVTWTLVVANGGPSVAREVVVSDDAPAVLQDVTTTGSDCTVSTDNRVRCAVGSLSPGGSSTITVTGEVPADHTGDLDNTGTVSSPTDTTPGNNTSTSPGTATPTADVSVVKLRTSGPIRPGQPAEWRIAVTNAGPSVARDVTVADDVVDALTGVTVSGADCVVGSGNAVSCALGDLRPGQEVVVTVRGDVPPDYRDSVGNTAVVASPTDTSPENNTSTVPGSAEGAAVADLSLTKEVTPDRPRAGDPVTFTLTVRNDGPSTATDVTVVDPVDSRLLDLATTAPPGADCSAGADHVVTCRVASLAPGRELAIEVRATLPDSFSGPVVNTATVTPGPQTDPDTDDNSATVATGPVRGADVQVTKTARSGVVRRGARATYDVTVTNLGPATARSVVLTDLVPAGLADVTARSDRGTCTTTTTVRCRLGDLTAGAVVRVVVSATVRGAAGQVVRNTVSALSPTSDPVLADNRDHADIRVGSSGPQGAPGPAPDTSGSGATPGSAPPASVSEAGPLPGTGQGPWALPALWAGSLLIALGGALVVAARRRSAP